MDFFLQTVVVSTHSHNLRTCDQEALATWASPVRNHLEITNCFYVERDDLDLGF